MQTFSPRHCMLVRPILMTRFLHLKKCYCLPHNLQWDSWNTRNTEWSICRKSVKSHSRFFEWVHAREWLPLCIWNDVPRLSHPVFASNFRGFAPKEGDGRRAFPGCDLRRSKVFFFTCLRFFFFGCNSLFQGCMYVDYWAWSLLHFVLSAYYIYVSLSCSNGTSKIEWWTTYARCCERLYISLV